MEKNFKMMNTSKLEDILYIPTEAERKEITIILVNRYKAFVKNLLNEIEDLEGKNLSAFGLYRLNKAKQTFQSFLKE